MKYLCGKKKILGIIWKCVTFKRMCHLLIKNRIQASVFLLSSQIPCGLFKQYLQVQKNSFCATSSQVKRQWIVLNLSRSSFKHCSGSFLCDCSFLKIIAKRKVFSECKQVEVSTTDYFTGFLIKVRWFVLLVTLF